MAGRSRSYGDSHGWDSVRDDYNNSDQYDDDNSAFQQINPRRLYVTNIPHMLNGEGLRAAFSQFGTIEGVFISKDPTKKYGMITFETPGEAKLALMKMNRTEPLKLSVRHAQAGKRGQSKEFSASTRDKLSTAELRKKISRIWDDRQSDDMTNGNDTEDMEKDMVFEERIDPELHLELESLRLQQLKVQAEQLQCQHRMLLLKQADKKTSSHQPSSSIQCILPDGRIVSRNSRVESRDADVSLGAGAGDSNETTVCSCKAKVKNWDRHSSGDSSTPSTCVLYSEDRSAEFPNRRDKSVNKNADFSNKSKITVTVGSTTQNTDYSNVAVSKKSDATSKKYDIKKRNKSEVTCDLKYSDFYSDSDEDADETNRLIQLRHADYMDIVEDNLKLVIALAGYPKSKMRLRQMELFQRSLGDVIDMQLKAGLLKKVPSFLDYYLNRGALVFICKDSETRDWMVRVSPGLQERMSNNLVLLKAKVKRLCLAILKIPQSCWPATAQDAFKLLQYFNPTLKTDTWKIYAQKTLDGVECTSFLVDRISGEIIRGPSFKNVIDYDHMEFELTGYTEIYYECLMTGMDEDLRSVASRVKLLDELRSEDATPRNASTVSVHKVENIEEPDKSGFDIQEVKDVKDITPDFKKELESSLQKDILKKLKDVTYISEKDEVLVWSDETNNYNSDQDNDKSHQIKHPEGNIAEHDNTTPGVAVSEKSESIIESNDNLISRNSNVNIDSNRGIAYHRRTNYLHVENELKVAITLEGYPQNKLEGTHIRRLKHLFKEYLHKDMKLQRFANLIIPKFQDIYLSNGAVIYVCDSLETKDYLTEVLPKFINSTGLKLTFRDIKSLVRYTRIVMRLPKDHAHVESVEILLKLQAKHPNLKPDCWKYYSDVAGKQKRQFGVDPESLEVIKSPDFDPTYEGDKITFRIIDRQKRDVSFEEGNKDDETSDERRQRERIVKNMYVPIDQDITNSPLTRIRTNHYSDLIADDLKLYVGPANYPETRVDEPQFHLIKRTFENVVCESYDKGDLSEDTMPKFHDMYLFDGVIFIICCNMASRTWIEDSVFTVNAKMSLNLKSTEFRGAVGIISMVVKTDKDTDDVIALLQRQNPRLRTKYWRRISTVHTKTKLDVVLQIDKLSAQVITSENFNKFIGSNAVEFKLGHLQSLLPKVSLEELSKAHSKKKIEKELRKKAPGIREVDYESAKDVVESRMEFNQANDSPKVASTEGYKPNTETVYFYTGIKSDKSDLDPVIIEPDSPKTDNTDLILPDSHGYCKVILKIPVSILPESKDDLNIIFDLLEDKNPGLNTELWQLFTETMYPNNGKFTLFVDKQSVSIIQGKNFDPTIGGERLKFFF